MEGGRRPWEKRLIVVIVMDEGGMQGFNHLEDRGVVYDIETGGAIAVTLIYKAISQLVY